MIEWKRSHSIFPHVIFYVLEKKSDFIFMRELGSLDAKSFCKFVWLATQRKFRKSCIGKKLFYFGSF